MSKNTGTSELINYFDLGVNGDVGIAGSLDINTIANATTDTDTFLVSDTGIIKYRTGAQLLSDIGAAPAVAGGYVPYTGATTNVDLGVYNLTASAIIANGSGSNSGIVHLESNAIHSLVNGYGSIASGTTNQFNLYQTTGAGVFRGAILSLNSITEFATRTYTLPDADGTLALTSSLGAYLPLAGGTLTGALNGTSATFSTEVTSSGGQGRFGGWATGAGYQGNALEVGVSGGNAFMIGYNRTSGSYIPLSIGGNTNQTTTIGGSSIVFQNNGVTALTIASTGAATFSSSVGIGGATNTLGFLEVWKSGSSIAQFSIGQNATYHTDFFVDTTGNFYLQPQGTTRLTITSSGNVGIGTTSPVNKLSVLVDGGGADDGIRIGVGSQGDGIKIVQRYLSDRVVATLGQSNYGVVTDSGALRLYDVGGTETVRLSGKNGYPSFITSGNVLIGTQTDAGYKIDVAGTGRFIGPNVSNRGQLSIQSNNASNAARASWYYDTTLQGNIGTTSGDFYVEAVNNLQLLAGGNISMGTQSVTSFSKPFEGQLIGIPNAVIVSGIIALGSPYTQNIQIDIVYNNWGGNNVIGLVDMIITLREFANIGGTAFGKIFAVNGGSGATFTSFNTSDVTTSQCTVTATSGGNYTLRITIDPSNITDRGSYYLVIPNSGGTGSAINSVNVSFV